MALACNFNEVAFDSALVDGRSGMKLLPFGNSSLTLDAQLSEKTRLTARDGRLAFRSTDESVVEAVMKLSRAAAGVVAPYYAGYEFTFPHRRDGAVELRPQLSRLSRPTGVEITTRVCIPHEGYTVYQNLENEEQFRILLRGGRRVVFDLVNIWVRVDHLEKRLDIGFTLRVTHLYIHDPTNAQIDWKKVYLLPFRKVMDGRPVLYQTESGKQSLRLRMKLHYEKTTHRFGAPTVSFSTPNDYPFQQLMADLPGKFPLLFKHQPELAAQTVVHDFGRPVGSSVRSSFPQSALDEVVPFFVGESTAESSQASMTPGMIKMRWAEAGEAEFLVTLRLTLAPNSGDDSEKPYAIRAKLIPLEVYLPKSTYFQPDDSVLRVPLEKWRDQHAASFISGFKGRLELCDPSKSLVRFVTPPLRCRHRGIPDFLKGKAYGSLRLPVENPELLELVRWVIAVADSDATRSKLFPDVVTGYHPEKMLVPSSNDKYPPQIYVRMNLEQLFFHDGSDYRRLFLEKFDDLDEYLTYNSEISVDLHFTVTPTGRLTAHASNLRIDPEIERGSPVEEFRNVELVL